MSVFVGEWAERGNPQRILSLGWHLPVRKSLEGRGALKFVRETGEGGYRSGEIRDLEGALRHTREIDALNAGRKWALRKFHQKLDAVLAEEMVIVVVPSHDPFLDQPPTRQLAQLLCEGKKRADATGCLVRVEKIQRIVFGGPSYESLHRDTIHVRHPELLLGKMVLLLDDVTRSGASLRACRNLLREAGAVEVQCLALGRVR